MPKRKTDRMEVPGQGRYNTQSRSMCRFEHVPTGADDVQIARYPANVLIDERGGVSVYLTYLSIYLGIRTRYGSMNVPCMLLRLASRRPPVALLTGGQDWVGCVSKGLSGEKINEGKKKKKSFWLNGPATPTQHCSICTEVVELPRWGLDRDRVECGTMHKQWAGWCWSCCSHVGRCVLGIRSVGPDLCWAWKERCSRNGISAGDVYLVGV